MKFEKFIASRYLISKHKLNFITVISIISILGITVGVAALIVVLSIFNGFGTLVTQILVNFDPHIKIEATTPTGISNYETLEKEIENYSALDSYSPFVEGKVVVYSSKIIRVVNLYGIGSDTKHELSGLKKNIVIGNYKLAPNQEIPAVIIGLNLATRLQSVLGDTITIVSPVGFENALLNNSPPRMRIFTIGGIYNSHNKDIDAFNVYAPLEIAQDLLGTGNAVNGFDIRLKNINDASSAKSYFQKKSNQKIIEVSTWFDLHKQLYSVMLIERWVAYIILSLIIAVATFSIFGSLTMTVMEKKRDIGVLKSLGVNDKSIMKIFLFEGILVGVIGTILGVLIGLSICYLQIIYKLYPLDPSVYIIDALPIEIRITDIIAIGFLALLLSTIAGLYPAKKAAKTIPLEAIRWE
ncbi:MAG: ABC transporter permease [Ignavibacteria bacterium]|nr:ABC transporter permease [Ignavibacteria bacterium]